MVNGELKNEWYVSLFSYSSDSFEETVNADSCHKEQEGGRHPASKNLEPRTFWATNTPPQHYPVP